MDLGRFRSDGGQDFPSHETRILYLLRYQIPLFLYGNEMLCRVEISALHTVQSIEKHEI